MTSLARDAVRLPLHELRFWIVQAMVVGLAAAHLGLDLVFTESSVIPAGVPVALLLAPVSYAALRYGLAGSVATALWATLLWLPDLLLPRDRGHVGNDLIELALVIAVASFVGYHIDAEQRERTNADQARTEWQAVEVRYQQLFDTNTAPILVADSSGTIVDANPAARVLIPGTLPGRYVHDVLGDDFGVPNSTSVRIIAISIPETGVRDYRVSTTHVHATSAQEPLTQLVLEDITQELAEGRRVHRFAGLLLQVQEQERRRIAQELHDEPLQALVHLARSLEKLGTMPEAATSIGVGVARARQQTLDVASRLRTVVTGLRPPALEQLGLTAALRGFLADIGETATTRADLQVTGTEKRLPANIELAAFRIAQEAVNNVIRHANANHLLITLAFADGKLCLRVIDDGGGFDPLALDEQPSAEHLGLLGMRERAAHAGGQLTVQSGPAQGTTIEATFATAQAPDE